MRIRHSGYILIETLVAMAVLSLGASAMNGALRDALQTRGQAMDYTEVRFILDTLMGEIETQPGVYAGVREGIWRNNARFRWQTEIRKVPMPEPSKPRRPGPEAGTPGAFRYPPGLGFTVAARVTIEWTRSGQPFSESYETLLPASRLIEPKAGGSA